MRLKDKIIVVTGGNGLIGKAILQQVNQDGGIAINADISVETDMNRNQHRVDITKAESVEELINNIRGKFERIDGWVNNAYPHTKDWGINFEDEPFSSWQENVNMHLNGYALCCKFICEQMKKQGNGSVVNMSSIYGILGPDFTVYEGTKMTSPAAYAAIKGGIINFTRFLASYYGPAGIRVNCISPGGIFDNQDEIFVRNFSKKTPLKRMGHPDDVAPPISFLLSEEAKYITGHNLIVDGGWSIV